MTDAEKLVLKVEKNVNAALDVSDLVWNAGEQFQTAMGHSPTKADMLDAAYRSLREAYATALTFAATHLDSAVAGSVCLEAIKQPMNWDEGGAIQNWRNHVGPATRVIWDSLTPAQKAAIAMDAEERSNMEDFQ